MHERYDAMWSPFHWDRPREPAVCYFSRYFRWSILNLPLSPPLKHTLRHNHEVWVNRQKNTPTGTVPSPMRAIQSISAICYCWHPSNRVNFLADSYVPLSNLERQKRNSKENFRLVKMYVRFHFHFPLSTKKPMDSKSRSQCGGRGGKPHVSFFFLVQVFTDFRRSAIHVCAILWLLTPSSFATGNLYNCFVLLFQMFQNPNSNARGSADRADQWIQHIFFPFFWRP